MKNLKIIIIGAGALGKAVAHKLKECEFNLVGIASRSAKTNTRTADYDIIPLNKAHKTDSDVYIFSVPDKVIGVAAKKIAKNFHSKKILIHLGGCISSDILKANKYCVCASAHPMGSFKNFKNSLITLEKVHWTLEGDKDAVKFMKNFINNLSGKYCVINKKDKALYHGACTLASAGLLSLIYASCGMLNNVVDAYMRPLRDNNKPLQILWPLISSSLENLQSAGFPDGVTGPWARKDKNTIKLHKDALKNYDKNALKLYKLLGSNLENSFFAKK